MPQQSKNNVKSYEGRWKHLYKLWSSALSQESLPQFDRWLSQEFAKNSKYGSRDRRWYSECLFAAIRYGYFALFCEEFFLKNSEKTIQNNEEFIFKDFIKYFSNKYSSQAAVLHAWRNMNEERFFVWIRLRYLFAEGKSQEKSFFEIQSEYFLQEKEFFNLLINILEQNGEIFSQMIFMSIPIWLQEFIEKRIQVSKWNKTEVESYFSALETRPPLWIRLNDPKYKENVLQELIKEGFTVEKFNDSALKVLDAKGLFALKSYRDGLFEIQDLASQQIGNHVSVKPGHLVWDCCAGGGGKTQQIASLLKNKGVIYASDIREYKLEEVKKRARRSGFFNIRCLPWNGVDLPQFQKEVENKNGFDWVLVDAPCSSTGTWRRNPDAKYRVTKENLISLTELQLNILKTASIAVRSSGHLVYSTCSWVFDENEGVIEQFLKLYPEFTLVEQNMLGSPFANADTMFVAVMKRELN